MKIIKIVFYTITLILCAIILFKLSSDGHPIAGIAAALWLFLLVKGGFYAIEKSNERNYVPNFPNQQSEGKYSQIPNEHDEEEQKKESDKNNSDKKENDKINKNKDSSEEYFFSVLNISPNASIEEIKRGYKEEIRKYHPDKVEHLGDEFKEIAERKTKDINKAYNYFRKKYNF